MLRGGILIRELTRKFCRSNVDLKDAVLQFIFLHRQAVRAEGVRFDHVHADFEKGAVDFLHGFGIRYDEVVVTTVKLLAAEMFGSQVLQLQARSHRAIEDKDFLFEGVEVAAVGIFAFGH